MSALKHLAALRACLFVGLMLIFTAPAAAEIKGPNGEACSSSESGVKHDIKGKTYTCDKCVVLKCGTGGSQISNCTSTTTYSNCVAAVVRPGAPDAAQVSPQVRDQPSTSPPKRVVPDKMAPATRQ